MTSRVDRILEILDVGEQHTTFAHYGVDVDEDVSDEVAVLMERLAESARRLAEQIAATADQFQPAFAALVEIYTQLHEQEQHHGNTPTRLVE